MLQLAILISGRGSNMQAIHRAIVEGRLDAEIVLVLSDQAAAAGLHYARAAGLATAVIEKSKTENREAFTARLIAAIEAAAPDYIALAGFMRILAPAFIRRFPDRILNIHPSLLPEFPGLHAQRQALEAKARISGCTVHFVDEGCDTGPILAQRKVPILPEDSEAVLSARILEQEHLLYPECLQLLAEGRVKVESGKVILI
ncbi:MAG TPA: phosphoribosylglycinamide formyltransferase [Deltaproteobacteria bacterium]|nr:phosphoribosylglycinamide formyltransferase [Deltaproteobacteria bacterium]